jgi:outer membrane protein assembly factor BamB
LFGYFCLPKKLLTVKRFFFESIIWISFSIFFLRCERPAKKISDTVKIIELKNKDTASGKIDLIFPSIEDSSYKLEFKYDFPSNTKFIFQIDEFNPDGIFTFLGGNQRNSPVRGVLNGEPKGIKLSWSFKTSMDSMTGPWGHWGGGAGWTGQPLVVKWKESEIKNLSALHPEYKTRKFLTEIIQVSLCGKIYFIDFETGLATRAPLEINNPIKGTPSIDAKNKNFLMVGQGIPHRNGFAWRCFNLKNNSLIHTEKTPNSFSFRHWGASDASPLIEPNSEKFIWPTESGVIYFGKLNQNSLDSINMLRYQTKDSYHQGLESSPSALGNLVYFSDNGGNVFCLDLNTMKLRWHYYNKDDSDATPVIQIIDGIPYIFVGNEVDKQGVEGIGAITKLNGLNGTVVWRYEKKCFSFGEPKPNNGGMLSTPCIGRMKAENLIWTIFSLTEKTGKGTFVCLDINSGAVKYELEMENYSWVSPIALYDKDGNPYVYFSDVAGRIYLINGLSGKVIHKEQIGALFESSPVAWDNRIIQPSRGNKIFSFVIE